MIGKINIVIMMPSLVGLAIALQAPLNAKADSGYVRRHAANVTAFGFEVATNLPPAPDGAGGAVIYSSNFFIPGDINTLYVTISATSDAHLGAREMLSCLLDGNPCNPSPRTELTDGTPSGWINVGSFISFNNYSAFFRIDSGHDDAVDYTWCTPFNGPPGSHNVQVKLASAPGPYPGSLGATVFLEQVHFFIDGVHVEDTDNGTNACTADPFDGAVPTSPIVTTAPDGTLIDTTPFVPFTAPVALQVTSTPDR
jgi:hypothetical protein